MGANAAPRSWTEPVEVITEAVRHVEPELDTSTIHEAIAAATYSRSSHRTLAAALETEPGLLTSGRPVGPPTVARLIGALLERGGQHVREQCCARCGKAGRLPHRDGDLRICRNCGRAPDKTGICAVCNRSMRCSFADPEAPICYTCQAHRKPKVECSRCGHTRRRESLTADGAPLCPSCAKRRNACSVCGKVKPVQAKTDDGNDVCRECHLRDSRSFKDCVRCGAHERRYRRGMCVSCAAPELLVERLTGPDGTMHPDLQPVFDVLAGTPAMTLWQWLRKPAVLPVLRELAQAEGPVTHATLDALPYSRSIYHLRSVLVTSGVLAPRDEYLARLDSWVTTILPSIGNPDDRQLVTTFATWHYLRRFRRSKNDTTRTQVSHCQEDIRGAIELLTWLRGNGKTLADCTKADVDLWMIDAPRYRYQARPFVMWAVKAGHARDIEIPRPVRDAPMEMLDEDERWGLIRTLLHDETISLEDRVAGLLVVLTAQHLRAITSLTLDDITSHNGTALLQLGSDPLELPPPVDELVLRLAAQRERPTTAVATPWLFPGKHAGRSLSPGHMMIRLARIGIKIRPSRNAAMMDLASDQPAVVLSRLLGITIRSATRWNDHAGAPGHTYAAELVTRAQQRTTAQT